MFFFLLDPYSRPTINQIINNNLMENYEQYIFFFCMNERYDVLSPLIVGRSYTYVLYGVSFVTLEVGISYSFSLDVSIVLFQ